MMDVNLDALEKSVDRQIAAAESRGYARGIEAAEKAVTGKFMVGQSPIGALHGIGWNAAIGCAVESIRALLPAPSEGVK